MADHSGIPILAHLQNIEWKPNDPNVGECTCPVHGDGQKSGKNSLHIEVKPGDDGQPKLVMFCHAGCTVPEIVASLGLTMASLFTPKDHGGPSGNGGGHGGGPAKPRTSGGGGSPAAAKPGASGSERKRGTWDRAYTYRTADRKTAHQTIRLKDPKSFYQRRPANPDEIYTKGKKTWEAKRSRDGSWWLNTLNGIEPVVYNLPEILASAPGSGIFLVEGEKDADTLTSLKLLATTVPMGSGKWRDSYTETFRGRIVLIIPDMDRIHTGQADPLANCGVDGARKIAAKLVGIAARVSIVYLRDFDGKLTPKWDITDWVAAHPGGPEAAKAELTKTAYYSEILTPGHPGLEPAGKSGNRATNQTPDGTNGEEPTDEYGIPLNIYGDSPPPSKTSGVEAAANGTSNNGTQNGTHPPGLVISNFRALTDKEFEALPMKEIMQTISHKTGGWPKRIGGSLFFCDRKPSNPDAIQYKVDWLDRPASLFGWMQTQTNAPVQYHRGIPYAATKEETYAELQRNVEMYSIIERYPHHPRVPGVYYACPENHEFKNTKFGCLNDLVDMFSPETNDDRSLIMALILTLFWGGPGGRRPLFVISSDAGRGAGKTSLAELIASLVGGALQLSANADDEIFRQRLLSPEGMEKRIVTLDNIKSLRFSWAEFEALITSEHISGKRMYVGEGSRMNLLVYLLTINGPSFSTDLAQRSVVIKLARADYQTKDWYTIVSEFIKKNIQSLISEILGMLAEPGDHINHNTRWAQWENEVLSKTPNCNEVLNTIISRQSHLDVEQDESAAIQAFFEMQLTQNRIMWQTNRVFIPSQMASKWLGVALDEKYTVVAASRKLNQMIGEGRLPRLMRSDRPEIVGNNSQRERGFWMTPVGWTERTGGTLRPDRLRTMNERDDFFQFSSDGQ